MSSYKVFSRTVEYLSDSLSRGEVQLKSSFGRIYDSVKQSADKVAASNLVIEYRILSSHAVQIREAVTWERASKDILVRGKEYWSEQPLGSITDLRFSATADLGEVAVIPADSTDRRKRFLLFPIPPLTATDPRRRVVLSAILPRAAHNLREKGQVDRHSLQIPTTYAGPVDTVTITADFDLPGRFRATIGSPQPADEHGQVFGAGERFTATLNNVEPGVTIEVYIERVD